jgi:hypothetical protein
LALAISIKSELCQLAAGKPTKDDEEFFEKHHNSRNQIQTDI